MDFFRDDYCEYCNTPGFMMSNNGIYLETHHLVPLAEGGLDRINNVVALCPNHHREAHYGQAKSAIYEVLKAKGQGVK